MTSQEAQEHIKSIKLSALVMQLQEIVFLLCDEELERSQRKEEWEKAYSIFKKYSEIANDRGES